MYDRQLFKLIQSGRPTNKINWQLIKAQCKQIASDDDDDDDKSIDRLTIGSRSRSLAPFWWSTMTPSATRTHLQLTAAVRATATATAVALLRAVTLCPYRLCNLCGRPKVLKINASNSNSFSNSPLDGHKSCNSNPISASRGRRVGNARQQQLLLTLLDGNVKQSPARSPLSEYE